MLQPTSPAVTLGKQLLLQLLYLLQVLLRVCKQRVCIKSGVMAWLLAWCGACLPAVNAAGMVWLLLQTRRRFCGRTHSNWLRAAYYYASNAMVEEQPRGDRETVLSADEEEQTTVEVLHTGFRQADDRWYPSNLLKELNFVNVLTNHTPVTARSKSTGFRPVLDLL